MTLTRVPNYIYRVTASNHATSTYGVFTSRDEAREFRSDLRGQGWSPSQMTTTRFTVDSPTEVSV